MELSEYADLIPIPAKPPRGEAVVLIHGLARGPNSLFPLQVILKANGYEVFSADYPSTEAEIEALPSYLATIFAQAEASAPKIHAVTHSMGGIMLRDFLSRSRPANFAHAVMMAPPNQGSEIVDKLGWFPAFRWINGKAGLALGTSPDSWPNRLPPADFSVGIIAGTTTVSPWFSAMIEGDDDGKVSVESTKLEGMRDHLVLPVSHTWMMFSPEVLQQTLYFLEHGRFNHKARQEKMAAKAQRRPPPFKEDR